ncbi:hypothetical protein FAM09_04565 [Niastella caeni]|uniref:Uncharacterized protein n=1 Tax=Niastella caeni TaxID=2569763 RepID=A0A4V4H1Q9_9BACT|nr:hypothetical protein [Niastella caeni]THU41386.1 hypothetical protein FAM09_04565 [Niastella caeni]
MKNTLLAVLIIALCHDQAQAQNTPGYINYRRTSPTQPVGKRLVTTNMVIDGVVSTDQLATDILIANIMADGVITSDKLADDIMNSLENMESGQTAGNPAPAIIPVALPVLNAVTNDGLTYAAYMQSCMPAAQELPKPRPTYHRTGWLQ